MLRSVCHVLCGACWCKLDAGFPEAEIPSASRMGTHDSREGTMGFYVERAARLNRHYMRAEQLGWGRSFDRIVELLGFTDRSPSEWEFAEAVQRWQKAQRFPLVADGVVGPN